MNTQLAPVHSLETDRLLLSGTSTANLSFAHRLELRLGLWLLLRSARRRHATVDRDDHRRLMAAVLSRAEREHAALRAHALGSPRT